MMIIGIKTLYWKNQSFGGITVACVGSHRLPVATDIQKSSAKNSFLCCNWLADFYENWHECSLSLCQQLDESWFLKLRSRSSDIKAQIFKIEAISLKISMKFLKDNLSDPDLITSCQGHIKVKVTWHQRSNL